jgi:hypothetical protein
VPQVRFSVRPGGHKWLSENDSPPDTEKFPRLAERILTATFLRLRLKRELRPIQFEIHKEKEGNG